MTGTLIIAGYTLRECVRRRVFVVVLVLSVLFLKAKCVISKEAEGSD